MFYVIAGMVGLLSASRRRRIRSEALKTETAEARKAVKRTAKARTGGDSFDDLLKEAKKRQKVDSGRSRSCTVFRGLEVCDR